MALDWSSNPAPENSTVYEDEVPRSASVPLKGFAEEVKERAKPDIRMSELAEKMREKEEMLASVAEKKKKGPLRLLDLPMDVLKDIMKEVRSIFECQPCSC